MPARTVSRRLGEFDGLDGVNLAVASMQAGFGSFVTVHLISQGWAPQEVGLALTISTMASLASQMPAGAAIDSLHDKRRAVRIGILGVAAAAMLLALTSARPAVYVAQGLQGLASSLIGPGIAAISLTVAGRAGFSERIGRNARYASIGSGLTSAVMGAVGSLLAPTSIFWLAAVLSLPALLSLSRIPQGSPGDAPGADRARQTADTRLSWSGVRRLMLDRRLLIFALAIALFFVSGASLMPGVAARVTMRAPEFAALIVAGTMLLPQAIVAAISPWIGRKAERSGRRPMLLLGWSLVPVQAVLFATLAGPYALAICLVLNGFSSAIFGVMMTVVAGDLTHGTGRFNLTLGALGIAIALGASVSTTFAGLIAGSFGGTVAYLGLACVGVCGLLLLWIGMPETAPTRPDVSAHARGDRPQAEAPR